MIKPDIKYIKTDIYKKLKRDFPDANVCVKWDRLKTTKFPSGLSGFWCYVHVTGNGYKPRDYTFTMSSGGWLLR